MADAPAGSPAPRPSPQPHSRITNHFFPARGEPRGPRLGKDPEGPWAGTPLGPSPGARTELQGFAYPGKPSITLPEPFFSRSQTRGTSIWPLFFSFPRLAASRPGSPQPSPLSLEEWGHRQSDMGAGGMGERGMGAGGMGAGGMGARGMGPEGLGPGGMGACGRQWQPRLKAEWINPSVSRRPLLFLLLALLHLSAPSAASPARHSATPQPWGRVTRHTGLETPGWGQEVPAPMSLASAAAAARASAAAEAKTMSAAFERTKAARTEEPKPRMRIHAVRTSSPVTSIHDPRLSPRHQAATWAHAHRNLLRHQGTYQSLVGQDGDGDGGGEGEGEPLQSTAQTGNESAALAPTVPPAPPATPQNLRPWAGLAEGHEAGPMAYHGGPVLSDPLTVYLIYYGNWTEGMGQVVFEEFIHALSNSSVNDQKVPTVHEWWELATMYTEQKGGVRAPVSREVRLGQSVTINSGYRVHLGDGLEGQSGDVSELVLYLVGRGDLPVDPRGYYAVLTSGDITVGSPQAGFCKAYCGFHSWVLTPQKERLFYGFVGDSTTQCSKGCGGNLGKRMTANGYYRADSMVDTFAHELIETATNPDVSSGWWALDEDGVGQHETADLCSSVYVDDSNPQVLSNRILSYKYNLQGPNGFRYLVQTVVDGRTQTCALSARTAERGMQRMGDRRVVSRLTFPGMAFQHLLLTLGLLLFLR